MRTTIITFTDLTFLAELHLHSLLELRCSGHALNIQQVYSKVVRPMVKEINDVASQP